MIEDIKKTIPNDYSYDLILLLSGGVDSTLLAIAMNELGVDFMALTFFASGYIPTDLKIARKTCKNLGIYHEEISFDTDVESIAKSIPRLHSLGAKTKTEYECFYPMLNVYDTYRGSTFVSGLGCDGLFAISKKACIHYKDKPWELSTSLVNNPRYCQRVLHKAMCDETYSSHVMPYLDKRVYSKVIGKTWNELNKPKQKNLIYESAKDYFDEFGYPKHTNYQKGDSRIDSSFHSLVDSKYNLAGSKSSLGVINQIVEEEKYERLDLRD